MKETASYQTLGAPTPQKNDKQTEQRQLRFQINGLNGKIRAIRARPRPSWHSPHQ